ncbi:DNAse I-like superfamily protein [Rhynchospora pubera]|uniref:DNAse I-like superfamily protein n=1 Tax=Rhynchospora pubera TaxID=906938 RepID=A0AAV8G6S9_9POAL|nr:DNAse I-like superfamily protein [Rhynchospora pubera]
MGDFNEIASSAEKFGGSGRFKPHMIEFQNFIFHSGLVDVGYKGPAYTWTNKRNAVQAIYQRLDRVLVTPNWLELYPNAYVNHLPIIHSDHCPILLRVKKPPDRSVMFRVENWWLMDSSFNEEWIGTWNRAAGGMWHQRWGAVRSTMRGWASNNLTPKKKLEKLANQIQEVQCQHPSVRDHSLEEKLLHEYDQTEEHNNAYWRQRSRIQWLEEGDRNTKFFHTVATNRRRHNLITMAEREDGTLAGEDKEIKSIFLNYFKEIYSPTRSLIGPAHEEASNAREEIFVELAQSSMQQIPTAAHTKITALPNFYEIKRALFDMSPDKSPGPDGCTARFLQTFWHIVGADIVNQVKEVFITETVPD